MTKSSSAGYAQFSHGIEVSAAPDSLIIEETDDRIKAVRIGHCSRCYFVFRRTLAGSYRNIDLNGARLITLVFLGMMVGVMFFGRGSGALDNQAAVLSMLGVLQITMGFFAVGASNPQVSTLFQSRPLFYREQAIGMYPASAYYLSLVVKEALYIATYAVLVVPVLYLMLGLRLDSPWPMLETLLTYYLSALWMTWLSQLWAAIIGDVLVAYVTVGVVNKLAALFNGIFVGGIKNYSTVPRFVATYLNPLFMANVPLGMSMSHCTVTGPGSTEAERLAAKCPSFTSLSGGELVLTTAEGFVGSFVASSYEDRFRYYLGMVAVAAGCVVLTLIFGGCCTHNRR